MNNINLIPDKILYRGRTRVKLVLRIFLIIICIAIVMVLLSIRTYQRMELEKKIHQVSLSLNNQGLSELEQAETKLAQKQEESDKINLIYNTVPQNKLTVSELLQRITNLMPPAVVAESISYKADSSEFTLNIKSANRSDIALFLKRLHDDAIYLNINISEITGQDKDFLCSIQLDMNTTKENK